MKMYDRRIMFLISDQHFIPHGGIGQFAKAFVDMANSLNWKVDILLDQKPTNKDFVKLFESIGARLVFPKKPIAYSDHAAIFMHGDSVNLEKITNFRNVIMQAFESNLYDLVLCNTQESMSAAYLLQLNHDMPILFYTHLHSMIFREHSGADVFLENYHHFYNKHMEFPNIFIGTQSDKNKSVLELNNSVFVSKLPIPLPERELLEPNFKEREGVLFIGRWESGKNPEAYIRVMKECGLPCRVMTSPTSAKKFEKAFEEAGITDYVIKSGITGKEKADFIKGSRVHFNPSLRESWGIAFMECMGHMPSVVLDMQDWSDNFVPIYYYKTSLEDAASLINALYSVMNPTQFYSETGCFDYILDLDEQAPKVWNDFVNGYQGRQSKVDTAKINNDPNLKTTGYVQYNTFIKELDRKKLSRIDFESVLTNRYKFVIKYTDNHTYLGKDDVFEPNEGDDSNPTKSLFELE